MNLEDLIPGEVKENFSKGKVVCQTKLIGFKKASIIQGAIEEISEKGSPKHVKKVISGNSIKKEVRVTEWYELSDNIATPFVLAYKSVTTTHFARFNDKLESISSVPLVCIQNWTITADEVYDLPDEVKQIFVGYRVDRKDYRLADSYPFYRSSLGSGKSKELDTIAQIREKNQLLATFTTKSIDEEFPLIIGSDWSSRIEAARVKAKYEEHKKTDWDTWDCSEWYLTDEGQVISVHVKGGKNRVSCVESSTHFEAFIYSKKEINFPVPKALLEFSPLLHLEVLPDDHKVIAHKLIVHDDWYLSPKGWQYKKIGSQTGGLLEQNRIQRNYRNIESLNTSREARNDMDMRYSISSWYLSSDSNELIRIDMAITSRSGKSRSYTFNYYYLEKSS